MKRASFLKAGGALIGFSTLAGLVVVNHATQPTDPKTAPNQPTAMIHVRLLDETGAVLDPVAVAKVDRTDQQWRARLTPQKYKVARRAGTERPFCGIFHDNHRDGVYLCTGCGLPLFRSDTKFDSGTGWPSFFQPLADENIGHEVDNAFGMRRTEVHCARCRTHLGHVFNDGPPPTRLRYCINSESLDFLEAPKPGTPPAMAVLIVGAGCFWGVEDTFRQLDGVTATEAGYAGGQVASPSYQEVCSGSTGHAEVVRIIYDPAKLPMGTLLETFFGIHDASAAGKGNRWSGTNYRSVLYFTTPAQEAAIRAHIHRLDNAPSSSGPIATEIDYAPPFFRAEEYHQQYLSKHGRSKCGTK